MMCDLCLFMCDFCLIYGCGVCAFCCFNLLQGFAPCHVKRPSIWRFHEGCMCRNKDIVLCVWILIRTQCCVWDVMLNCL